MRAPDAAGRPVAPREAIAYHAANTEECLRLALFADGEPTLGQDVANGLRKLAAVYSATAFSWSRQLTNEVTT